MLNKKITMVTKHLYTIECLDYIIIYLQLIIISCRTTCSRSTYISNTKITLYFICVALKEKGKWYKSFRVKIVLLVDIEYILNTLKTIWIFHLAPSNQEKEERIKKHGRTNLS